MTAVVTGCVWRGLFQYAMNVVEMTAIWCDLSRKVVFHDRENNHVHHIWQWFMFFILSHFYWACDYLSMLGSGLSANDYVKTLASLRFWLHPSGASQTLPMQPRALSPNQTIIGSDNDLAPGRRQAIIWTNAGILWIRPLGTNFSEILIEIYTCLSMLNYGKDQCRSDQTVILNALTVYPQKPNSVKF